MSRVLMRVWMALALATPLASAVASDVIRTSPKITLRDGYAGYPEFMKRVGRDS